MGYQSGRFDEGFVAKLYFEDFKAGDVAEYGDKLVTVEEIKEFAAEFDPQPMHLDEEAAKKTMMGGLCASGWHTCGIMMRIVADGFILNSSSMGAPGLDEIRWLAPVRPGDRLRVKAKVLETREPDKLYPAIPEAARAAGAKIVALTSPDNNLASVFRYLQSDKR